jgi:hypothetical protein
VGPPKSAPCPIRLERRARPTVYLATTGAISGPAGTFVLRDHLAKRGDGQKEGRAGQVRGWSFGKIDHANGVVVVIHVPRSWIGPHMAAPPKQSHFHSRGAAGRVPLDVHEIRKAFLAATHAIDRIRGFRDDRIGRVVAPASLVGQTSCPLSGIVEIRCPPGSILTVTSPIQQRPMVTSRTATRPATERPQGHARQESRRGSVGDAVVVSRAAGLHARRDLRRTAVPNRGNRGHREDFHYRIECQ